jgi:hypothetical protein
LVEPEDQMSFANWCVGECLETEESFQTCIKGGFNSADQAKLFFLLSQKGKTRMRAYIAKQRGADTLSPSD